MDVVIKTCQTALNILDKIKNNNQAYYYSTCIINRDEISNLFCLVQFTLPENAVTNYPVSLNTYNSSINFKKYYSNRLYVNKIFSIDRLYSYRIAYNQDNRNIMYEAETMVEDADYELFFFDNIVATISYGFMNTPVRFHNAFCDMFDLTFVLPKNTSGFRLITNTLYTFNECTGELFFTLLYNKKTAYLEKIVYYEKVWDLFYIIFKKYLLVYIWMRHYDDIQKVYFIASIKKKHANFDLSSVEEVDKLPENINNFTTNHFL